MSTAPPSLPPWQIWDVARFLLTTDRRTRRDAIPALIRLAERADRTTAGTDETVPAPGRGTSSGLAPGR